jgi:hypothetical protein
MIGGLLQLLVFQGIGELLAALVASVVATIGVSAWLLKVLSPREDGGGDGDAPAEPPR